MTTDELVTDEIWIAFEDEYYRAKHTKGNTDSLRAALNAVAPSLIARGMREAGEIVRTMHGGWVSDDLLAAANAIEISADALTAKGET